ncbi:unnamed protein product, partial [Pylaiella littoralis]
QDTSARSLYSSTANQQHKSLEAFVRRFFRTSGSRRRRDFCCTTANARGTSATAVAGICGETAPVAAGCPNHISAAIATAAGNLPLRNSSQLRRSSLFFGSVSGASWGGALAHGFECSRRRVCFFW